MIKKSIFIPFDKIFPQTKGVKVKNKKEAIALAKNVASALKKESEKLVKEKQDYSSTGLFSSATQ